jgi:signal transduction histidine kinase
MSGPPTREPRLSGARASELLHAMLHAVAGPNGQIHRIADLLDRRSALLDEESRTWIAHLAAATEHLDECLAAVRRFVAVFDLPCGSERFPLSDAVASARKSVAPGCVITTEPLPEIEGDRRRIELVLHELLDNACKFAGPEGPVVHISAHCAAECLEVAVADQGIGIDPGQSERIFRPFVRLWGDRFPGAGIGLAIARALVENWAGRIWADPAAGSGSVFRFTLPLAAGSAPPRP